MRTYLALLLLLCACATSSVRHPDGTVYQARVLGAGAAEAGDCAIQQVDLSTPTADSKAQAENRTLVANGKDCAMAEGGRASTAAAATATASWASLLAFLKLAFF